MKAAVPWRSLFCGGDGKWGVFRYSTLGAGVGLDGGYDGNFRLLESGSWEIFPPISKFCNTELPVWRVG